MCVEVGCEMQSVGETLAPLIKLSLFVIFPGAPIVCHKSPSSPSPAPPPVLLGVADMESPGVLAKEGGKGADQSSPFY